MWYRHDAEQIAKDLAMLGKSSSPADGGAWKLWELQQLKNAKASVKFASAGACLLNGKVNTAKHITQSVSPNTLGNENNFVVDHDAETGDGVGTTTSTTIPSSPSNNNCRLSSSQLPIALIDTTIQNSVLYYMIRDGKVKEALQIMQASRML